MWCILWCVAMCHAVYYVVCRNVSCGVLRGVSQYVMWCSVMNYADGVMHCVV